MKKNEIEVGKCYIARVSGVRTRVRIEATHPTGGWFAINEKTGRRVRILTAARLSPALTEEERDALIKQRVAEIEAANARYPFVYAGMRSARLGLGWRVNPCKRGYIVGFGLLS